MIRLWIIPGGVIAGLGLLDLFLSSLDYDESGLVSRYIERLLWRALRPIIRRLPKSWRGTGRGQVLGLEIVIALLVWVGMVIVGFGFVYYGLMHSHNFKFSGSHTGPSMDYAMYFSVAQLSTVGAVGMTPDTTLLRILSVVQTLIGLGLVTLTISFLMNTFQTITQLRKLASDLYLSARNTGDPLDILSLYFAKGQPVGLSSFLDHLYGGLSSYHSGLRLHNTAYYYQSREVHVSIPYAIHALGGVIEALRWGLPPDSTAVSDPSITLLARQFSSFLAFLDSYLHRQAEEAPAARSYDEFRRAYNRGGAPDDPLLDRFLALARGMSELAQCEQAPDAREIYERYSGWLPFACHTQATMERVAQNLGYDLREDVYEPRN